MKALTFLLRLKTPLLATQTESGEPNSATTFSYIPGSMIRGAVINRLSESARKNLAIDDQLRSTYLDGATRFLNAYAAHPATKARMLPAPRSWRVDKTQVKDRRAEIFDFAIARHDQLEQPKQPKTGELTWLKDGVAALYSPGRQVMVHNASENRNIKQTRTSTVYRYEALAEGEVFAGVILGSETALNEIRPLLMGEIWLGGSRTGGYGTCVFEDVNLEGWAEYAAGAQPPQDKIIVTLLSDAIIRGEDGSQRNSLDDALGAAAVSAFTGDMHVVGGFNRTWGLPLTQDWAIPAGSVFVYPAQAIDAERLDRAVTDGVGERRAEGFGRIAVNWHTLESWKQADPGKWQTHLQKEPLTSEARILAKRMAERQLRAVLDAKLIELVANVDIRRAKAARPSQMARVRVAARQALFEKSLGPVTKHLESLYDEKGKEKVGARQLSDVRVNGLPLINWLEDTAKATDLSKEFGLVALPEVAGQTPAIDKLQAEYLSRLIDGVLKRAIKLAQSADENGHAGGAR